MRRLVAAALLASLVAACGGARPTGTLGPGGPTDTSDPDADLPSASLDSVGAGGPRGRPSGARIRVFNGYVDPVGTPVTLELHAAAFITERATPLATVAFGELSAPFDPTVFDESGNGFLVAYAKGESGNGNSIMSTTMTIEGTEAFTYVITRGDGKMANGRAGGLWTTHYDPSARGVQEAATPAPGKARVRITAAGLDNVVGETDASWEVSFGKGCARDIGATDTGHALVSPGTTGVDYDLDPGTYTFSIHPQDPTAATPDCGGKGLLDGVPVQVEAGSSYVLPVYAASPTDIRATLIPLQMP